MKLEGYEYEAIVDKIQRMMQKNGLTVHAAAKLWHKSLGLSEISAQQYISEVRQMGVVYGIQMGTRMQQVHIDRLAKIFHMLRIPQDDTIVALLKERIGPSFAYPPASTYLMQPRSQSPKNTLPPAFVKAFEGETGESQLETKIAADNQKQYTGVTSLFGYLALRAVVINATALKPSASSEVQRAPRTVAYAGIQAAEDPYDALAANVEPAYPKELVGDIASGLHQIVSHVGFNQEFDRRRKGTLLVHGLAGEARRIFGEEPTLGTLVKSLAADIASLEAQLHGLEAEHLVALLPDGAYVATREGVQAYKSSPISKALFSQARHKHG